MRRTTFAGLALAALLVSGAVSAADRQVTVGGHTFVSKGLVGVGRMPANLRDKFGETFGSGSGMTVDPASWRRVGDGYEGTFFLLPDRGYNVAGTTDYQPRFNRLTIRFTPGRTSQDGVAATLADTVKLTDAAGQPMTGLDPEAGGVRPAAGGFPDMPQARNGKIALDPEAIASLSDGTFFISDEYGPYIYRFSAEGRMLSAVRPPDAFIPMRKGRQHFGSNNSGPGAAAPEPPNPETGRQNNQGFEGMALTPDGRKLAVVLQSATRQDGGDNPATRNHTRILVYDVADPAAPKLTAEHVVPLPVFKAGDRTLVAAQSELTALSDTLFLMLSRDSGNGYGVKGDKSLYRGIDILDISEATNIANTDFDRGKPVAPKGVLDPSVTPAALYSFIDINDPDELGRFGLHNGAPNDKNNLSEKWEAMSLVSVLDPAAPQDFFLVVANDNDFMTQDGFQVGAPYRDESGADVDTTFLVYRVSLPTLAK
jgi:hypothetical protein